jgi:microsomal dipeptidase-like Zn-dependent dipeptidase
MSGLAQISTGQRHARRRADVSMLPNITYELLKRGYSERDIRKILGEKLTESLG